MIAKVYLASRYEDRERLCGIRTQLEAEDIIVTSRWLNGSHEMTRDQGDFSDHENTRFAQEDLEDVAQAHVFVGWSPRQYFKTGRGGRHVELGFALALGMPIILVGERENVFHWMPKVIPIPDEQFLSGLIRAIMLSSES